MDSFKFHDVKKEKANAISRYRRNHRIATLFRFAELFVFLIVISGFSTRFAFSFDLEKSIEHLRGISLTLISPRFVFILGNAIVIALFFISRQFSTDNLEISNDFYEEYVEKCRKDQKARGKYEKKKPLDALKYKSCLDEKTKVPRRSQSASNLRSKAVVHEEKRRSEMRRCTTGKVGRSFYVEDGMSSEDFRLTVEAFIARRQRLLKEEEEEVSAVVL